MVAACKAAFVTMKGVMACMEKMGEMGKAINPGASCRKNRVTIKSQIDSLNQLSPP